MRGLRGWSCSAIGLLWCCVGCGFDPKTTLTVRAEGRLESEAVREALVDVLSAAVADGGRHRATFASGEFTVLLAPVTDVDAYTERLQRQLQRVNESPLAVRLLATIEAVEGRAMRILVH